MNIKMILLIAVLVVALVLAVYGVISYIRNHSLEQIREKVYELFLLAENNITGTKRGRERLDWVVCQSYYLLPKFVQGLISIEFLYKVINKWFKAVKDLLDDGKINGSSEGSGNNGTQN